MRSRVRGLTRPEKILLCLYELAGGANRLVKYEDLVVKAFRTYPEVFQLRGYPKHPDSSDIHKPLYGSLKRKGFVLAAGKTFALTESGAIAAQMLLGVDSKCQTGARASRLPRDVEAELDRIRLCAAFRLFAEGRSEDILDTDFLAYLGVTVRTPRNDFLGRLSIVSRAVDAARDARRDPVDAAVVELHGLLLRKFGKLVGQMSATQGERA